MSELKTYMDNEKNRFQDGEIAMITNDGSPGIVTASTATMTVSDSSYSYYAPMPSDCDMEENAGFRLRKSILSFYEHRKAAQLLRATLDEIGITPGEVNSISRSETLDHFRNNALGWNESRVTELLDSVQEPQSGSGDPQPWDRVVALAISDDGDGLFWLDGQGDWSAPGDDVYWVALDFNAEPEYNLELLRGVQKHRLEPRFAAMIEKKIQEYEALRDECEDEGEADDEDLTDSGTLTDDDRFLEELQKLTGHDE